MTIEKGKPWGEEVRVPDTALINSEHVLPLVDKDAVYRLISGDLWRALGEPEGKNVGDPGVLLEIDAFQVTVSTEQTQQVHLVSSSVEIGTWIPTSIVEKSRYVAVTNSGFLNGRNIAPRAHPNDGYADAMIIDASTPLRQRFLARRRATTATHIPHPNISVSRSHSMSFMRQGAREYLRLDGVKIRHWDSVQIQVIPDYWRIII